MTDLPNRPFLKIKEVAGYFGVCPRTIRRWANAGEIEVRRIGGSTRITRESLEVRMQVADLFAWKRNI
jgi:excisionase family DNA binding protein